MDVLHRLDAWLGKTLFQPLIILLCQRARQSQYAIYRAFWFFAACHTTYYSKDAGFVWLALMWLWTISLMASAVLFPDRPTISFAWFRLILWSLLLLGIPVMVTEGHVRPAMVRDLMILFAEYAATIKTIPPRKKREQKASLGALKGG